jgi:hypothetical protein
MRQCGAICGGLRAAREDLMHNHNRKRDLLRRVVVQAPGDHAPAEAGLWTVVLLGLLLGLVFIGYLMTGGT